MKNFFIIISGNNRKAKATISTRDRLAESLLARGAKVDVHEGYISRDFTIPSGVDCVITLGGDGTVLRAARAGYGRSIALLGINRGNVGYLTELSRIDDYETLTDRLINDDFMIEERMMLTASAARNGELIYRDHALNETLLGKNDPVHMMGIDLYINDIFINSYRADGMIIATPTGSTCYSMSAGGPIAEPKSRLLIVTPICPYAMNNRALVLSAHDRVKLIPENPRQIVSCDGSDGMELKAGDELTVEQSEYSLKFIRFKMTSFLDTLRDKMKIV